MSRFDRWRHCPVCGSDLKRGGPSEHEGAAVHELLEETGLAVDVGALRGIFTDSYGDDGIATLNLFYEARVTGGDAQPKDDVSEILWLEPGGIDPERFAFACCREAIRLVVRKS
jgi:8-oxo-dGTP pyrophosphatase MutT (NUDIX family)